MAPVVGLVGLGLIHRGFPTVGVAQISILSTTVLVNSLYGIFHITLFYAFLILFFISARELCRNWYTDAVVGHWIVTSK
jgi:hypothetical protein